MARSNYSYAKRLKEINRQKKQEEKRLRKQAKAEGRQEDQAQQPVGLETGTASVEPDDEKGPEAQ